MGKRPFQNLGPNERRHLALAAVATIYLVFAGLGSRHALFTSLGADYLAFWSAGYIANTEGYAHAYDLDALRRVQAIYGDPSIVTYPVPAPILPIFLAIFQLFSLIPLKLSFIIWTILNICLAIVYLHYIARYGVRQEISKPLLLMMISSFPVFWNLFWGQVNFLLLVCVGEFLRAMSSGKPFRAGAWLGGLWLKPQTLVLLVPALLLQRSWKALSGWAVASLGVVGASIGIGGLKAMCRLANLWLGYASGLPTNYPQWMVNWRMVGIHLSAFLGPEIGWGIALAGLTLTVLAALYLWRRPLSPSSPQFGVALLGTMAATCVATWHSHLHMMVIIIPPLMYILYQFPLFPLDIWLFSMPVLLFMGLISPLLSGIIQYVIQYGLPFVGFILNISIIFGAVRYITYGSHSIEQVRGYG